MRQAFLVVARLVTEIVQPPVVLSVMLVISGVKTDRWPGTWWAGAIAALFTCLLPWTLLALQIRKGSVTDRHVSDRKQRAPVLFGALASTIIGVVFLLMLSAPTSVYVMLGAFIAGIIVMIAVSPFWKVSGHATAVAGTATILTIMFGWWGAIAILLIPAICWSRIHLDDHSRNQVFAGSASGIVVIGGTFALLTALI